jgi:outer membrane protein OmpA-like peptidoglycan-associated protein
MYKIHNFVFVSKNYFMKTAFFWILIMCLSLEISAQQKFEVFFDFNKFEINPIAKNYLLNWIANSKEIEVQKIYGFCDWKGTNSYNDTLSTKRVQAVYEFLKERNVSIRQDYETRGFGEDFEQSKVQSENRKVSILFGVKKVPTPKTAEAIMLEELNLKIKTSKVGDFIKLKNIYFFNNSPKLLPKSKSVLYELLCVMNDNPKLKIEIQGHICCQTKPGLYDVSPARAKAIYNFLVLNGINKKRLSYKGFGTTKPIHSIPEKTELEEEDNRRVEIMIVEN